MSVQSEIDRINGAKSTLAANIESAGFTAVEGASIVQLASTVGDAFTDTSSRLATVNGTSGTISTQLDTLYGTKTAIKDAIVAKGVDIPEGTVFRDYAGKIVEIETGAPIETVNLTFEKRKIMPGTLVYLDGSGGYKTASSGFGVVLQVEKNTIVSIISDTVSSSIGDIELLDDGSTFFVYGDCTITTY